MFKREEAEQTSMYDMVKISKFQYDVVEFLSNGAKRFL